jgi:hypothetical protein
MYVAYLRGLVVIVVGFVSAGVIVMSMIVMRHRQSCSRVMITLGVAAVVPIAGGVPMRRFPNPRLV